MMCNDKLHLWSDWFLAEYLSGEWKMPQKEENKMNLYEYAVVYTGGENSEGAEIIVEIEQVLAADESAVEIIAARKIPGEFMDCVDDIDILVRSFP